MKFQRLAKLPARGTKKEKLLIQIALRCLIAALTAHFNRLGEVAVFLGMIGLELTTLLELFPTSTWARTSATEMRSLELTTLLDDFPTPTWAHTLPTENSLAGVVVFL